MTESTLLFNHTATSAGNHDFAIQFYTDNGLSDRYKTITMSDGVEGWTVNGVSLADIVIYDGTDIVGVLLSAGEEVIVEYVPDKNDDIFDRVFYVILVVTVS